MPYSERDNIDGVTYICDAEGYRTSVVFDIEKHRDLLEDILDALEARAILADGEPTISWNEFLEESKNRQQEKAEQDV
ncbi:hypothetical protein [Lewinella sp. 4G2]|uniref:hypothetical protein n=1 Tax=Lewinella sp. 4G2 TaxID=1803372 RepID=UPI0007B48C74|nr:hypothetical protein [Lewinella sp. 4G2]OAV43394.1 hypothetical protein A3850_002275 [Lewinella sp. 4G2]